MSKPEEHTKPSFICAALKRLEDGCVARCDNSPHHIGKHCDSVIAVAWEMAVPSAVLSKPGEQTRKHGATCPKVEHVGDGWLHDAADDTPYGVDGVMYCGRCHTAMAVPSAAPVVTEPDCGCYAIEGEVMQCRHHEQKMSDEDSGIAVPDAVVTDLAQRIREILTEGKSPQDGNPTTYISWLQAKLLKIHKEVAQ